MTPSGRGAFVGSLAMALVAAWSPRAGAEESWFLLGEAGAAMPMSDPQRSLFGTGGTAVVGAYRSVSRHALAGLRLRGGILTDTKRADASGNDPGMGGLAALTLAARLTPLARPLLGPGLGLWLEAGAGAGLTGSLARPVLEAGIGIGFRVKNMVLGPAVRYLQVIQGGSGPTGTDAKIAFFGVELALFDRTKAEPPLARMALQPIPPPLPVRDADGDGRPDRDDKCPDKAEDADGVDDADGCPDEDEERDAVVDAPDPCPGKPGCPDATSIQVVDDRVVLEENVIFNSERARVKSSGRRVLAAVVEALKRQPGWDHLEVEGHADVRGPEKFNQWLSEERAQRVRAVLIRLGVPEAKITAKGFGSTRPRAEGKGEQSLWRNRRVELVIVRKGAAGGASVPAQPGAPR